MKIEKLEQRVEILAQKIENGSGGSAPADAYTKAQADAKFETQAHAEATYATKTQVSNLDEVPTVGSTDNGKVLTAVYSEGTGSYEWGSIPTPSVDEVPDVESTDDGKVLTATYSGGEGSYAWATPAAGGVQVETDGTNYWITVNGIRLYFASSAPTGTIPAGSYGIGW